MRDDIVALLPKLGMRARKLTMNDGTWQDLMHDTIVSALAHEAQFKPGTNLSAWLYTIMRNEIINQRRRKPQEPVAPDDLLFIRIPAPSARAARDELMDVQRRLEQMPEWARQILEATIRHDSQMEVMADELHMPVGTVKSRLNRARQMMAGAVRW